MKKYILLAIIFFGMYEIAQAYEIGEYVCTNKAYKKCFGENEKKLKRLVVNENIGTETFHTISYGKSQYHCIRCGGFLRLTPIDHYCTSCKIGFNIKEE